MTDFDAWAARLAGEGALDPTWLPWLQETFDAHGPLDEAALTALAERERLQRSMMDVALARAALPRVLADAATAGLSPSVELRPVDDGETVLVVVDGNYTWSSDDPFLGEAEKVAAFVAERVADETADERWWPVCPGHHRVLHAAIHHGRATWMCPEAHPVATVGTLGET